MERLMSDELGTKYSWKGQKGKDKLKDLKIAKIILGKLDILFIHDLLFNYISDI